MIAAGYVLGAVLVSADPPTSILAPAPPAATPASPIIQVEYLSGDQQRTLVIAVSSGGDFYERQWTTAPSARNSPSTHEPKAAVRPFHYVSFSGGQLIVSETAGPQEYQRLSMPDYAARPPGPIQWLQAPWPVLERMKQWLRDAPDLEISQENGATRAGSISAGLSLLLDDHGELLECTRGDLAEGDTVTCRYTYAPSAAGLPLQHLPTSLSWVISAVPARGRRELTQTWNVVRLEENAAAGALLFDPASLNVSEYNRETGLVTHPVKGVLYNRNELERLAARSTWQYGARPWAICAAAPIVIAGLVIGYRRLRSQ